MATKVSAPDGAGQTADASGSELSRRTAMLAATVYAATRILRGTGWRASISDLLAQLGRATGVSRAYVFEVHDVPGRGLGQSYRYEWVDPAFPSLLGDPAFQNITFDDKDEFARELLNRRMRGETIRMLTREMTGFVRAHMEAVQLRSLLTVPIMIGDGRGGRRWWGTLGFDDHVVERVWAEVDVQVLETVAATISAAIEREGMDEELENRVKVRTAELQRTLDELRQTQADLIRAEKLAALGQLVAGVAHEVNTPVGNALTSASLIADEMRTLSEAVAEGRMKRSDFQGFLVRATEAAELLQSNLERAANLVQSFKQVAVRLDGEPPRPFAVRDAIEDALLTLAPTIAHAEHRVVVECAEELGIVGHRRPITEILVELITNAIVHAFSAPGGTIRILARPVAGDAVELSCADDGWGVATDILPRAFDPFVTTRRSQGHIGLGLHIVFSTVVDVLKGSITLTSPSGSGTVATIRIPCRAAETAARPAAMTAQSRVW